MYLSPAHSAAVKLMLQNIVFTDLIRHTAYVAKNAKLKLISSMKAKKKLSRLGTAAPDAVGAVTVTMSKDGVPVSGATASGSVSTAANPSALPITAIVRNACDCDSSILSFNLSGTASTVQNVAVTVVKL